MKKFLLGIVVGLVFAGLAGIILVFSAVRLGDTKPTISDGSTLVLNLRGDIPEKAPVSFPIPIPFLTATTPLTVPDIWDALHRAAGDSRVKALVLVIGSTDTGWAKASEIREDILNFKK